MTTLKTEHPLQSGGLKIPGTEIALSSILRGAEAADGEGQSRALPVRVISQNSAPRWVLPEDARRAARVLRSWRPYGAKSRLQWRVIVGASRMNLLGALPGAKRESLAFNPSYWARQLPEFSASWDIVAYIGNPSPTRKALLFFIDGTAGVRAVAKAPIRPAARAAILNEASILVKLQDRLPLPRVLFADDEEGIAAQTWVEGWSLPRAFTVEHLELLTSLGSADATVRLSDCARPLEERIAEVNPAVDASLLGRALSLLQVRGDLRACVEHGDFAPWNLRRLKDGRLSLIDWEWAVETGYPWQDVCRYFYLQDYLFKEKRDVWDALMKSPLLAEYRLRFGISPEAVRGLTARYLIRYLCDEHEEGNRAGVDYASRKLQEMLDSRS